MILLERNPESVFLVRAILVRSLLVKFGRAAEKKETESGINDRYF